MRNHVPFELACLDRLYVNVYPPHLQTERRVCGFLRRQGRPGAVASGRLQARTQAFVQGIEPFARQHGIALLPFAKHSRKEDVAAPYRAHFTAAEGLYLSGKAQEQVTTFRTERRRNPTTGASSPWLVRSTALVKRALAWAANRRRLDVQRARQDNALGEAVFRAVTTPQRVGQQRVSALPYGDPLALLLRHLLLVFRLLPGGFRNRELREHLARLLGQAPQTCTPGQLTYHLRRLRLHGLIARQPAAHRYRGTERGLRVALAFTRS